MQFPRQIVVRVSALQQPVPGLLIDLSIPMKRKNDYGWLVGPSDANGVIEVSEASLRERVEADRNLFIMDYVDPEHDAKGQIRLSVPLPAEIDAAVSAFSLYRDVSPYPPAYGAGLQSTRRKLLELPVRPSLEVLSVTGGSATVVVDQVSSRSARRDLQSPARWDTEERRMKTTGRSVLLLAAALLGFAVRYGVETLENMNEPAVVSDARMKELTAGPCPRGVKADAPEFAVARALLQDRPSSEPEMEIRILDGCAFEYWIGHDSLLQGKGVVRFTDDKTAIAGLAFFNRLDTRLLRSKEPSFLVTFFGDGDASYAYDTWHERLRIVSRTRPLEMRNASPGLSMRPR